MKTYIRKYRDKVSLESPMRQTLVFFHGWGFDSQVWNSLVPRLDEYQIILVDLPGFGHTPVMDWTAFKRHLLSNLPEQVVLTGWSMGGLYAMRLALEEPHRVTALINVTSSPRFLLDEEWPGIAPEVFQKFHENLSTNPQTALKEFLTLQGIDELPSRLPSPKGLELGLKVLETWDFRTQLNQLIQPTCFMYGRLDPIVPLKSMKAMQSAYPEFEYVLFPRAAHIPFLSHTDLFIEAFQGFIQ